MLEIKLREEYDKWLRKIAQEVSISPEELAYMSIENFIKEYRRRKARKFMAILKDTGIPLNVGVEDFVKGFGFLSKLRGYEIKSE